MRFNQARTRRAVSVRHEPRSSRPPSTLRPAAYADDGSRATPSTVASRRDFAALTGVDAVSIASAIPGGGGAAACGDDRRARPGARQRARGHDGRRRRRSTSARSGVPLLRGRGFLPAEATAIEAAAVVNQRFVDVHFRGRGTDRAADSAARHRRARTDDVSPWLRIVGVAPNIRQQPQGPVEPDPVVYVSRRTQPPVAGVLLVRTTGSAAAIAPAVRAQLRSLDPDLPLTRAMTMDDALQQVRWVGQVSSLLLYGRRRQRAGAGAGRAVRRDGARRAPAAPRDRHPDGGRGPRHRRAAAHPGARRADRRRGPAGRHGVHGGCSIACSRPRRSG